VSLDWFTCPASQRPLSRISSSMCEKLLDFNFLLPHERTAHTSQFVKNSCDRSNVMMEYMSIIVFVHEDS